MALQRTRPSNHPSRHLPEDVLSEILCRLPVKSLLRFRCVSKPWLTLVDDDDNFARLHLNTFKNNRDQNRLFVAEGMQGNCIVRCADTYESISQIPPSLCVDEARMHFYRWEIVSSIDGLVLLILINQDLYEPTHSLKLWNPSLRQFRQVPPIPHLAPFTRCDVIGLGYDLLAKDYKIVTLIRDVRGHSEVAIYTVGADSWKIVPCQGNINGPSPWDQKVILVGNVYLQGRLYFCALWDGYRCDDPGLLWSFDLSNNVFSSISLPGDVELGLFGGINVMLVDGGSRVAMLYNRNNPIWVLETEAMVWAKRCLWATKGNKLLYCKRNGDMLISRAYKDGKYSSRGVALYKLEKHEYKILQPKNPDCDLAIFTYVESLILNK